MGACEDSIENLIKLATGLIHVADEGTEHCQDLKCVYLFGLAKDSGYRLRAEAERELAAHRWVGGTAQKGHKEGLT
jgi:hypothetical protein